MSDTNPAGWQPDPTGRHDHRYWDGTAWSDNVSDGGVAGTDPFAGGAAPEPAPAWGDPTTATPVPPADATAAWSTTPGAPVPPVPQAVADGSGGGGGSKKGLLVGGGILAAIALAVIAFLALGGDDKGSDDEVRAKLVAALSNESQGGLSNDDAECVADSVIDEVDSDVLADVDFSSQDVPDELAPAVAAGYLVCVGGDGDATSDTTESTNEETTTTEASSDDGGSTDTGGSVPDFEEMYADIFESTYNLSREQAECLAGKMADSIDSGDLNENDAATAIFDYLSDCDISLEEIGAN